MGLAELIEPALFRADGVGSARVERSGRSGALSVL
jgi:hypothetical protein